jgi:hypothetical protein
VCSWFIDTSGELVRLDTKTRETIREFQLDESGFQGSDGYIRIDGLAAMLSVLLS